MIFTVSHTIEVHIVVYAGIPGSNSTDVFFQMSDDRKVVEFVPVFFRQNGIQAGYRHFFT